MEEINTSSLPVGKEQIIKWSRTLARYKGGKAVLDAKVKSAERWWKLRNAFEESRVTDPKQGGFRSQSAWLHNTLMMKHAEYLNAYPEPIVLAREESDKPTAWALTKILPVVLAKNNFEETYDLNGWRKFKMGAGIYKIIWDATKDNGLGDISIVRRSILQLFWEPGIEDIQQSKMVFDIEMVDKDELKEQYPEIEDKNLNSIIIPAKMPTDDALYDDDKVAVIDVYYRKNGKLHYAKFVNDTILYASENDPEKAETGWYAHGMYPYVFDVMYPVEGSPVGYGLVDVCANAQTRIDAMDTAFARNTAFGANPRFFTRGDGSINEMELLDCEKAIVHVDGSLGEESLREIPFSGLSGNYIAVRDAAIQELRETSGNTQTAAGVTSGVTAASGIAAMQEASGKGDRASTKVTYRSYSKICYMCVELMREKYTTPRCFRILGELGVQKFIQFDNSMLQPQPQGTIGGIDLGSRMPFFDIEVVAQKKLDHTKQAQNELALQLYNLGMFDPERTDQALMCLNLMEFDDKDELTQRIAQQGTMYDQLKLYQQMALTLAQKYEPELVPGMAQNVAMQSAPKEREDTSKILRTNTGDEPAVVSKARAKAQNSGQPEGTK